LVGVVILDLVLAWVGMPVGWLRQLVRVLSVGTIAANAVGQLARSDRGGPACRRAGDAVGDGRSRSCRPAAADGSVQRDAAGCDPIGEVGARTVADLVVVAADGAVADSRYRQAVDTELDLRRAVAVLRTHYGRRWQRRAWVLGLGVFFLTLYTPADLVWMLRTGLHVDEACAQVLATVRTTAAALPDQTGHGVLPVDVVLRAAILPEAGVLGKTATSTELAPIGLADHDRFAEAVRLNREHWAETGRPISAETLRRRLRLGAAKSRAWCRAIRAGDRAAVCARDGRSA
jgi:hypothetical protein